MKMPSDKEIIEKVRCDHETVYPPDEKKPRRFCVACVAEAIEEARKDQKQKTRQEEHGLILKVKAAYRARGNALFSEIAEDLNIDPVIVVGISNLLTDLGLLSDSKPKELKPKKERTNFTATLRSGKKVKVTFHKKKFKVSTGRPPKKRSKK